MKRLLLLLAILPLGSCSLIFEAADISIRRSKEVSSTEQLQGDGFTLRPPEAGLYPIRDLPLKGGLTLRPTETIRDGLVYSVSPFKSSAATTGAAAREWLAIWTKSGASVDVLETTSRTFAGRQATRCLVEIRKGREQHFAMFLAVKRDQDFLMLFHGNGNRWNHSRDRMIAACRKDFQKLLDATRLTPVR